MKFFKRLLAWPFRRKDASKKKKRVYAYRGANSGKTRRTATMAQTNVRHDSNETSISDTGTWPTPHMLAELGARRDDGLRTALPIIEITKTRSEMLVSTDPSPISPDLSSVGNVSLETSRYPSSNKAVVGSPPRGPARIGSAVYTMPLPDGAIRA